MDNNSGKPIFKGEYDFMMTINADAPTIALPHLQNIANRDRDKAHDLLRIPKFSFAWR